jgi:hypothetical protein
MARSAITLDELNVNEASAATADAMDATNGHELDLGNNPAHKVLIQFHHTTAAEKDATILAGDNPPADAAGQGATTVVMADGSSTATFYAVVVESARHIQHDGTNDGKILIDLEASTTGFIRAYALP